jgi:uncharacterized protein
MAKLSLQEQLLKSGLVSTGQARTAKSEKHKQTKQQQHNKVAVSDDLKAEAEKNRLERIERDRQLNQQRQQDEQRKHVAAQIRQLIEQNRLPQDKGLSGLSDESLAYHFIDGNKVKTIYVLPPVRDSLVAGQLALAKLGRSYEIVPIEIAEKIRSRDPSSVISLIADVNENKTQTDDPYANYQVPDDLMW